MGTQFKLKVSGVMTAVLAAVLVVVFPVLGVGAAGGNPVSVTPYGGFDAQLTRAPYVTDLTQTSADVTWATTVPTLGTLKWGTGSNCTPTTTVAVPPNLPTLVNGGSPTSATNRDFTVGSQTEYQSTVTISGLTPGTTYCYRIFLGTTDLLGSNSSPTFTTLAAAGANSSVSFDVVGDLGETFYTTSGAPFPGAAANYNPDQAAIDHLISTSGAQFLLTAGDVAYSGGTQTDYGDLRQTGPEVSDMFGPSYWPETGGLPTFGSVGNHGQNVDSLRVWPESNTTSASGGVYAYDSYPGGVDGTNASSAPDEWYAFSTGNVRIYVLDAGWANGNVGTSNMYQVDHDVHWAPGSPEYQWLANDLAGHPGGVKMAVFHYPIRSDNSTESSDFYLQNSSANPDGGASSLEALLAANGVSMAFNGHAHTYQRINPRVPGQITNYVTGGGGGVLEPVDGGCSSLFGSADVYALGWSPTSNSGSNCGVGSSTPTSAAQVYSFLKVTVTGSSIRVDPMNAAGQGFDSQTYTAAGSSSTPSTPGLVTAAATSSTSIQVSWSPSTETGGTITGYNVLRKGPGSTYSQVATVPGTSTSYGDASVQPGTRFTYEVVATDNRSLSSSPGISNSVATPTVPGNVTAAATSGTSVQLNWTASSETGGSIQSYQINRNGTAINTVSATGYTDTSAQPGTTYTYSITAIDGIGAPSTPGSSNSVTTPGQASQPSTGGCMSHLPAGSVVGSASLGGGTGYYMVDGQGDVAAFGAATCYGAMTGTPLNRPIVGMAVDPATGGYWLVASDGGIFSFNAPFLGSTGALRLNRPIVGMASTTNGGGYWLVASDGGIFTFGNAPFYGSTGNIALNRPVVGMGVDQATGGYWLVASDGGIFSFNAPFYGSTGAIRLNQPVVGMITAPDRGGYRMVASDGGVFCFNEPFLGSTGNIVLNRPVIAGLSDQATGGYWLTASDGGVFSFGAPFLGSAA